jgi:hypothetical protein
MIMINDIKPTMSKYDMMNAFSCEALRQKEVRTVKEIRFDAQKDELDENCIEILPKRSEKITNLWMQSLEFKLQIFLRAFNCIECFNTFWDKKVVFNILPCTIIRYMLKENFLITDLEIRSFILAFSGYNRNSLQVSNFKVLAHHSLPS